MNSAVVAHYRQIRGGWGLAGAAIWFGFFWFKASAKHKLALAAITTCHGIIDGFKCSLAHGAADGAMTWAVIVAFISAPIGAIIGISLARLRVQLEAWSNEQTRRQQETARDASQRQQSADRIALIEHEGRRARHHVDRSDFIHKIGAVSDFLDLLADETDPARIANIRLGASQALRELAAKHTIEQLAVLIHSDEAVRVSARAVLRRLTSSPLQNAAEVRILSAALGDQAARVKLTASA